MVTKHKLIHPTFLVKTHTSKNPFPWIWGCIECVGSACLSSVKSVLLSNTEIPKIKKGQRIPIQAGSYMTLALFCAYSPRIKDGSVRFLSVQTSKRAKCSLDRPEERGKDTTTYNLLGARTKKHQTTQVPTLSGYYFRILARNDRTNRMAPSAPLILHFNFC